VRDPHAWIPPQSTLPQSLPLLLFPWHHRLLPPPSPAQPPPPFFSSASSPPSAPMTCVVDLGSQASASSLLSPRGHRPELLGPSSSENAGEQRRCLPSLPLSPMSSRSLPSLSLKTPFFLRQVGTAPRLVIGSGLSSSSVGASDAARMGGAQIPSQSIHPRVNKAVWALGYKIKIPLSIYVDFLNSI
jgi:hypothetical protein